MTIKKDAWGLSKLLAEVHGDVEAQLQSANRSIGHSTEKGDATESVWIDLFNQYLPKRYHAVRGHIADSQDSFSGQIDVIIHDRQYTPPIFTFKNAIVVPAESVYAVFEVKQSLSSNEIDYTKGKLESVRERCRTNAPIYYHGCDDPTAKRDLPWILGGLLCYGSSYTPPESKTLLENLADEKDNRRIDLVCVADTGVYERIDGAYQFNGSGCHTTRFLFRLIRRLQPMATVPAIDMEKYEPYLDAAAKIIETEECDDGSFQ